MATLSRLCEEGNLVPLDPGLEAHELPVRRLFGTPAFVEWLDSGLPNIPLDPIHADLSAMEQVAALFHNYLMGENFSNDRRFKKLNPAQHHVWEFKTDGVRIFGWIPAKDSFVCCFGDSKDEIVTYSKYGRYVAQTRFVREGLNLDEPKCVESREYDDVISSQD
jgi:hypothetical protein